MFTTALVLVVLALDASWSAPVPWELVDMTYTLDNNTLHWPTVKKFRSRVIHNGTTPEGYWLYVEEYTSATHVGTHMDAPCHFGQGQACVDEIPLDRLKGPAAVVDITDKALADRDALLETDDLLRWEELSGRSLNGTIVVMRSGWGRKWGDREAFTGSAAEGSDKDLHFPGMSPSAAQWLVDNRSILGVATETLSLDNGQSKDMMTHRILNGAGVWGLENVANVEEIPLVGAHLQAMPMKIGKGSGAPTRVVAAFPKVIFKPKDGRSVTERSLREVIIFS